jgi:hypothetical protein
MATDRALSWRQAAHRPGDVRFYFGVNGAGAREELSALWAQSDALWECGDYSVPPGVTATASELTGLIINDLSIPPSDIVILASDDYVAPPQWDALLKRELSGFDGLLLIDGYDRPKKKTNLVPLPIATVGCLRRLGVLYHPAYRHFFADQELYDVALELGVVKNCRDSGPQFEHMHWSFGERERDQSDDRNDSWWDEDHATYERRRLMPVRDRLKL